MSKYSTHKIIPAGSVKDIRLGENPAFDAWYYSFCAENNIEHNINPIGVASPEQLRFMVALGEKDAVYAPCSERTFIDIMIAFEKRQVPLSLLQEYYRAWQQITCLIRTKVTDAAKQRSFINYCRHRFLGSLALGNILPSRLLKRLVTTFISQNDNEDPWLADRTYENRAIKDFLQLPDLYTALMSLDNVQLDLNTTDIKQLRENLALTELTRLFCLAGLNRLNLLNLIKLAHQEAGQECLAEVFDRADEYRPIVQANFAHWHDQPATFLYLCDLEGGLSLDLHIIKVLLRMGHKVILALKHSPLWYAPTLGDMQHDPLLMEQVSGAKVIENPAISKNDLLRQLRESRLLVISDGTGEALNLCRTSTTFARAWKEADMVLAKGQANQAVLLQTTQSFTRDIFLFWQNATGQVQMQFKAHDPDIRKFSEQNLTHKAFNIIKSMRLAKDMGKSVMFYSCIIGSIPGQTKVAVQVADTFVANLREKLDEIFIINPAEYFEVGMDGDDLMFMWEEVQRSGLINIWRFQSMEDIEQSFALMNKKVPPSWSGKDATFSTGCTKEMRIALDMQRKQPELQIIGPGPEKFFRRADYGVGQYFDEGLRQQVGRNLGS